MNIEKLEILKNEYLRNFENSVKYKERFKWDALKDFKENWNINSDNLPDMLQKSFGKIESIMSGPYGSSLRMLKLISEEFPILIKDVFITIYNENLSLEERYNYFESKLNNNPEIKKYLSGKSTRQTPKTLMISLWIRYPEKYVMYEFQMSKNVDNYLEINEYNSAKPMDRINDSLKLYSNIKEELLKDTNFCDFISSTLDKLGINGGVDNTLVNDFVFASNNYIKSLKKSRKELDGSKKDEDESQRYWMYYPGPGACFWKQYYESNIFGIGSEETGDLAAYNSCEEIEDALNEIDANKSNKIWANVLWQFSHVIKRGDVIYCKKGTDKVIGRGIVASDYKYDENKPNGFQHIREITWTNNEEHNHNLSTQNAQITLNEKTDANDIKILESLFANKPVVNATNNDRYTREDFLSEAYIEENDYDDIIDFLLSKKNIILQGPPGVGKTFLAEKLAFSILGYKDKSKVDLIQFHQSYTYEDFIMGYKPTTDGGFDIKPGIFYNFCETARRDMNHKYFFIVDEINRGNLSKIFGELFMLIENDKRDKYSVPLVYSQEQFSIPSNVYLIGLMNTADRSLAMMDYALRRRFDFISLKPGFESNGFKEYLNGINNPKLNSLIDTVKSLNDAIKSDSSLKEGYCIGHSFFCGLSKESCTDRKLKQIVEYELIPLLQEYWFDEEKKVDSWSENLRSAIK